MKNINEELIYWGKCFKSEEDQLKNNDSMIIVKFALLEIEERVKEILKSKSNKHKEHNIIEIWTSNKNQEDWKLIFTHKK